MDDGPEFTSKTTHLHDLETAVSQLTVDHADSHDMR